MLEIKELFDSDNITIKGADDIDEVSDYFEFNGRLYFIIQAYLGDIGSFVLDHLNKSYVYIKASHKKMFGFPVK